MYADRRAVKLKRDGEWQDVTFAEVGEIVSEIGLGLIDLGIAARRPRLHPRQHAPRVDLLRLRHHQRRRRPWCRSTRPTRPRSASGSRATPRRSRSSARTPPRSPRSSRSATACPRWRRSSSSTPPATSPTRSRSTTCASAGAGATRPSCRARPAVAPDDAFTFIYTSGTTGPPKGCVLTHGNYRDVLDMSQSIAILAEDEVVYLYLPLAHAFALLIQLCCASTAGPRSPTSAATPSRSCPSSPRSSRPTCPRSRASSRRSTRSPRPRSRRRSATRSWRPRSRSASRCATSRRPARRCRPSCAGPFEQFDTEVGQGVRAIFGGRVRQAVTGAAPIAQEILEFFYACGVPVLEGYGMTETATVATYSTIEHHKFGTVGRALPGVEVKIADDGELLDQGRQHLPRATTTTTTPRSARSSTAGCTPATSARSTRTATSRSPAARRTSSSPRAART